MSRFQTSLEAALQTADNDNPRELYGAVSRAAMDELSPAWHSPCSGKRAAYFSMEFLIGRVVYANLQSLGVLEDFKRTMEARGLDPNLFEQIEDAALGNGGLGRLAACYLDSAAACDFRLDGFGIRYKYGLFRQSFREGFQHEEPDDWTRFGDPWSVRKENERVLIRFNKQKVWAVPYDMPIIGCGGKTVNTLRLWQAEPADGFDLAAFNEQDYAAAYKNRDEAEAISAVLYPADETDEGKMLRVKQQYFFSSASLQSLLGEFKAANGREFSRISAFLAIQLNDTHPAVAIPELLRLLIDRKSVV